MPKLKTEDVDRKQLSWLITNNQLVYDVFLGANTLSNERQDLFYFMHGASKFLSLFKDPEFREFHDLRIAQLVEIVNTATNGKARMKPENFSIRSMQEYLESYRESVLWPFVSKAPVILTTAKTGPFLPGGILTYLGLRSVVRIRWGSYTKYQDLKYNLEELDFFIKGKRKIQ